MAGNTILQDPESVGNALKVVSMRIRGVKSEIEAAGEETDGLVTNTAKLQADIKGLAGVDILKDDGSFKDTYTILYELGEVYSQLDDLSQASLLEKIAGKTRGSAVAAILQNYELLEEAYNDALNSQGSAWAENEKYLSSIQGRIDLFINALQTMWSTEIDSGVVKFFVDLGTSLVKLVDNLGLINSLVFSLMMYFTVFKKKKLDLASILGIHDIEDGWLNKRQKKTKASTAIAPTGFTSVVGEQLDMFSDDFQAEMQINDKIKQLNTAKAELSSLQTVKWKDIQIPENALEYYGKSGNRKRAYVNEVLIPNKQAEIAAIQKDIDDITLATKSKLNQSKMQLKEDASGQMMFDFDGVTKKAEQANRRFLDIFENSLGKGVTGKLNVDYDKFSDMLTQIDGMDGRALRQYMLDLGNLGDEADDTTVAFAAYISTVEDGNYSIQGAQRYVNQHNQSLTRMSKTAMKAQLVQGLLNAAISMVAMGISALVTWGVNKLAQIQDKFEELSSELSSITSEIESMESELENINDQIKTLQDQGVVSFSDKEELERLKAESAELERQIDFQKTLQKQKQDKMNQDAPEAAERFKNTGVNSGKTTGEKALNWAGIGASIGGVIAGSLITVLTGGLGTGLGIAVAGGIIAAGGLIGGIAGGISGMAEEKVGDNIDNMQEKYTELQQKYADAQAKYEETLKDGDYEKAQKAQEQLTEFEGNMAKHLSELNTYYDQMDWETATTDQREAMQDFYDTQDKWAIASGGKDAKVNAIDRMFGTKADTKIQNVGKALKEAAKAGEDIDLAKAFSTEGLSEADLEAFTARLYEMGIMVYEVEDAFKQAAEAAEDLVDTGVYEASKNVGGATEGLESLKSAFEELNEKGYVTAKTLGEMEETFGSLGNAWSNYANTMSSATASTEEQKKATEELAEAFLSSKLDNGPLNEEEWATYIQQLKDMGVNNAEEFLAGHLEKGMYAKIQMEAEFNQGELLNKFEALTEDDKNKLGFEADITFAELSNEQRKQLADYVNKEVEGLEKVLQRGDISLEKAREIASQYGYDFSDEELQNIIDKLEHRNTLEEELIDIQARQKQANTYDSQINSLNEVITQLEAFNKTYGSGRNWMSESSASIAYQSYVNIETAKGTSFDDIIDEEQFIRDYNMLRAAYANIPVELNLDNPSYQELVDKIKELEQLKTDLKLNPDSADEIQAQIDQVSAEIEGIKVGIDFDVNGLGATTAAINNYVSSMETLASLQSAVADGFTISTQEAMKFANTYPAILQGAVNAGNGQIKLNADVVNAVLQGEREKQNAIIDTQINDLKAQIAANEAKIKFYDAQIQIIQTAADIGTDEAWREAQNKINASNIALGYMINNGVDQETAYETMAQHMSEDTTEFQTIVTDVAKNNFTNMDNASKASADSLKTNADNMITTLQTITKTAHETAKAIKATGEGRVDGSAGSQGSTKGGINIVMPDFIDKIEPFDKGDTSEKQEDNTEPVDLKELYEDIIDPGDVNKENYQKVIDALNGFKSALQDANSTMYGSIAGLESLNNAPLKTFDLDKSSGGDDESAFERAQKEYQRKLEALQFEQDHIQGQIDVLEAKEQGVASSYYNALIDKENEKLDLYEAQLGVYKALLDQVPDGTDEWYEIRDAIYEIEKAMQDSVVAAIEFGEAMNAQYMKSVTDIADAYDSKTNIKANQLSYLEGYKESVEIAGGYASEGLFNEMIARNEEMAQIAKQSFEDQALAVEYYRNLENPYEEGTEEWKKFELDRNRNLIEAQDSMAQAKLDFQEYNNQAAQLKEEIKDTFIESWDNVTTAYDNLGSIFETQISLIEGYESRLEALNINVPDEVYEKKISTNQNILDNIDNKIAYSEAKLKEYADKYGESDERYIEKAMEINALYEERYSKETENIEIRQQIIDNQFDRFNQVIDRINNSINDLQNISDLLADEDVATESGEWTDEGITRLGLALQQMEYNKGLIEEYNEEMEELNELYEDGEISEKKYYERMQELEDGQWDAISNYEDMKDAIVELHEARIDMIEEGLNKEAEAYEELIQLKQDQLDSERELYDFRKSTEKDLKNIASLERRIASMSGSTDAATVASRTKLEAELREAKENLNNTYTDRAYDSLSGALDDELKSFTESQEDYLESLRESIKDTDLLIEQTYANIMTNGQTVLETLTTLSEEYGFYIDENLTSPWENATSSSVDFEYYATEHFENVRDIVETSTDGFVSDMAAPWKKGQEEAELFRSTAELKFRAAVKDAKEKQQEMTNTAEQLWVDAQLSVDQFDSFVTEAADAVLEHVKQVVKDINDEYAKVVTPESYSGVTTTNTSDSGNGNSGSGTKTTTTTSNTTKTSDPKVVALQEILRDEFGQSLGVYGVDGIWGTTTQTALKNAQDAINKAMKSGVGTYGKWTTATRNIFLRYFEKRAYAYNNAGKPGDATRMNNYSKKLPIAFHAKGTMGTTKDEWAITDEPWIGDELTMYATKDGTLSYMRAGSTVVPADLTKELMNIAEIGVDGLTMPKVNSGVGVMSNYVSKPEFNMSFDSLVHVDHCDQNTLKDLEKMVDTKINQFSKQMNYAIKRYK